MTFETTDLYMAAALQVAGLALTGTERRNGRMTFTFTGEQARIDELRTAWVCNTLMVPAQPFAHAVKGLKSVVHQG